MKEAVGDLWTYPADARVITTNGFVKNNGNAVMGRGSALEAAQKWPFFPEALGKAITEMGNQVFVWGLQQIKPGIRFDIATMPVKHNWWEEADLDLIRKSCHELMQAVETYNWTSVVMPRPGCGNGRRDWETEVRPILEEILDDRFTVITYN